VGGVEHPAVAEAGGPIALRRNHGNIFHAKKNTDGSMMTEAKTLGFLAWMKNYW
jgi:hypothetical protein